MKLSKFLLILTLLLNTNVFAEDKPAIVILYTKSGDAVEQFENIYDVAKFAIAEYNKLNNRNLEFKTIEIDDNDDPILAEKKLTEVLKKEKPMAIIGPIYSNVGLGLKEFVNKNQIPMISIFATHNYLTINSDYIFRICASNKRLVSTLAHHLTPIVNKNKLDVITFKDLSDHYSTDLADTFKKNLIISKINTNEVLFRGVNGLERLKDVNSKVWNPTKKDLLFLATQDFISGKILTSMESEPFAVAAIDPVNFVGIMQKTKKSKMHLKFISTAQWLGGKSDFSKKVEVDFKVYFKRDMRIPSALTFDAVLALLSAYERSLEKKIPLTTALKDGTKVVGLTGNLALSPEGERIFTESFIKEDILQ